MASNGDVTIPLKCWVDDKQKRVVMAEAGGDFVDILFSFLTLPLGTIIRLDESEEKFSQNQSDQPVVIGCIKNLYMSVNHLLPDVFWNDICQKMLLFPRNPLEASCQRLKLKVDDTPPTKYFMCHSCSRGTDFLLSTFKGARCFCRKLMKREMQLLVESKEKAGGGNGVFVKGTTTFLIFDDLRVIPSSPCDSLQPPPPLRRNDISKMQNSPQDVYMDKIFSILKQALTSASPLSDVFLENKGSKPYSFSPYTGPSHEKGSVEIKVIVSKSQNKILFAEVDGDFVDFLFSFLTTPLGSILHLMNGKSSLGSIDNLYKSVKNLDPSWFIGSSKKSLRNPKVAPQYGCKSNPLIASQEDDTPSYWYGTVVAEDKDNADRTMISKKNNMLRDPATMKLFDPRCSVGATEPGVGFVKRPCLFVVTDDLKVIPMATNSSIDYLRRLSLQLDDLEEHFVEIKKSHEALNLLRASLTSDKDVFTRSLSDQLKVWKCQRCIPYWGVLKGWNEKRQRKKKEKKEKEGEEVISDERDDQSEAERR